MSKSKETNDVQEVSVFPEGYEMNSWNTDGRETDLAASRTRVDDKRPTPYKKYKSSLWFPVHEIPEGWQYGIVTERLLGEPQNDNIQAAYEDGWDFVKQSDHPSFILRELYSNPDNRLRKKNCIFMKKPKQDYLNEQRGHMEESLKKQKEISWLTDYFGSGPNDPRFVVENRGSYTPAYLEKRGQ
jgi:hypothetical protein